MVRYGSIYKVTNNVNGKVYIGQTVYTVKKRWSVHCSTAASSKANGILHKAIKKYGKEAFTVEEIAVAVDKEALDAAEICLIEQLNTLAPNGYNLKEGGANGQFTITARQKMSEGQKRRPPCSDETARKLSEANRGRKFSTEHKAKLSAAFRGSRKPGLFKPIQESSGQVFASIRDAAESLGISRQTISDNLHGRSKTAHGFVFTYLPKHN